MVGIRQATLWYDTRVGAHVLLRHVTAGEMGRLEGAAKPAQVNDLVTARAPSELVGAALSLGTFHRTTEGMISTGLLTGCEIAELVSSHTLQAPRACDLDAECLLRLGWRLVDGQFRLPRAFGAKRTRGLCAEIGGVGSEDVANAYANDLGFYVVEPLADWVVLASLLSTAMRLVVVAGEGDDEGVLERADFVDIRRTSLASLLPSTDVDRHVLPLCHSPLAGAFPDFDEAGSLRLQRACTLIDDISEVVRGDGRPGSWHMLRGTFGIAPVHLFTVPSTCDGDGVANESWWLYLTVAGRDQMACAEAFLGALDEALSRRRVSCREYHGTGLPVGYPTVAGSLWAAIAEHDGRYLMCCERCGKTVLSTRQGPSRRFCSDSCRATFRNSSVSRRQLASFAHDAVSG